MTKHHEGFEVFEGGGEENSWYWTLRRKGRIVADGAEAYSSKANCLRAIRSLKKWLSLQEVPVKIHDHGSFPEFPDYGF